jgi:hypothetical protein
LYYQLLLLKKAVKHYFLLPAKNPIDKGCRGDLRLHVMWLYKLLLLFVAGWFILSTDETTGAAVKPFFT